MEFQLHYDFARSSEIIGFACSSEICLFHSQLSYRGIEVVMTDVFFIKTSYYCLLTTVQRWYDPHFRGVNRA